ncbi:NADPH-glutathione reductase [Nitzschia inconspicua]|uniref:NADPH-glutathione reductase n=1 Tax=Nitzschia inconspicua TaxID=303405 RepID=A0A9K3KNP6_9STRA|nr:NADPH-glutathione reductase [Nitzschia inconspicua]
MSASGPRVLHVAGHASCGFYNRITSCLGSLSLLFPSRLKIVEHDFGDRTKFRQWLVDDGFRNNFRDPMGKEHVSCPIIWISKSLKDGDPDPADIEKYLGGYDKTLDWCRDFMEPADGADAKPEAVMVDDGHTPDHGYEYDLVVIGGGSGGMAAAKEAASLGAKVALCDFVKPSPQGTSWGLGGTCVNVGCIPKKLYHIGATLRESIHADANYFGISTLGTQPDELGQLPTIQTESQWNVVKDNIQNYIRSLNFKYRVRLREKSVQYINKLATFKDAHTVELVDKKGRTSEVTASRFLVAVGGRPTPLDCEGADLAISSDDVFFLEKDPGKVLCVGASYISLECAGFLAGMSKDVTVAVRSILLRGFDRECSERIGNFMQQHGVNFKMKVTPSKLEKLEDDRIKVTFSDGSEDVYDTVLGAVGRTADTAKLGLENVNVQTNPKNLKIVAKNEQSTCPNIYAVGDVMEGCPELTPVAIQAGISLARRLFGGSKEPMDYVNVCTTVFTPIEYSCVGLSEDDAIEKYGQDGIEVYHREFLPLEWSLSQNRHDSNAFAKIVVDKTAKERVLGIHYVGPNAGEVMQGYGISMKNGLTYRQLTDTVGIHPTSSEEIVTLAITKSSGEDAAAGGC